MYSSAQRCRILLLQSIVMFPLRRYAEYRRSHFGEAAAKRNNSLGTPGGSTPPLPTIFCYDVLLFFLFSRQRPEWYLQNLLISAPSARTAHLHVYGILISYFFYSGNKPPARAAAGSSRAVTKCGYFCFLPRTGVPRGSSPHCPQRAKASVHIPPIGLMRCVWQL